MNVYVPGRRLDSLYVRPGFLYSRYPKIPPTARAECPYRRSGVSRSTSEIERRFPPIVDPARKLASSLDSFDRIESDDEDSRLAFSLNAQAIFIPYVVDKSIDEPDLFGSV